MAGAELPLPVGDVLHLAVGLHLGDDDVVELLADHPEQPVQIHVEVVQVPLVRAGVVVLFKEGVGQLRDDGVPVNVDDRLELVAVELDGAVAVVPHMRPLDEVGVLGEDLHDCGVGKVEPGIFNHRACEITAEVIEEELIVLHILIKFGPANIGTMQAQTAKWREK